MPFTDPIQFIAPYFDTPVPNINAGIQAGLNIARTRSDIPLQQAHTNLMNMQIEEKKRKQEAAQKILSMLSGGVEGVQSAGVQAPKASMDDIINPTPDYKFNNFPDAKPIQTDKSLSMPIPQAANVNNPIMEIAKNPMLSKAFTDEFGVDPAAWQERLQLMKAESELPPGATIEDRLRVRALNGDEKSAIQYLAIIDRRAKEAETEAYRREREGNIQEDREWRRKNEEQRQRDLRDYRAIMAIFAGRRADNSESGTWAYVGTDKEGYAIQQNSKTGIQRRALGEDGKPIKIQAKPSAAKKKGGFFSDAVAEETPAPQPGAGGESWRDYYK